MGFYLYMWQRCLAIPQERRLNRKSTFLFCLYLNNGLCRVKHNRNQKIIIKAMDNESKKTLCGVFALVIGCLGIQYFLIGKTTAGILTIVISLVTLGFWGIITFIQGIMILCMSEEEWERKFVNSNKAFPLF